MVGLRSDTCLKCSWEPVPWLPDINAPPTSCGEISGSSVSDHSFFPEKINELMMIPLPVVCYKSYLIYAMKYKLNFHATLCNLIMSRVYWAL